MKQIDECLDRFFEEKPRLKKKWQAISHMNHLFLYHYHHRVLVYDLNNHQVVYEWWEKPADKRGLDVAKEYLKNKFTR